MRYFDYDDEQRKPAPKKPKRVRCRQQGCRRDIEDDGYGEFVHKDTGLYQCDPRDQRLRMAMR